MTAEGSQPRGRVAAALRWTTAVLVVTVAHASVGWWVVTHVLGPAPPPDAPQGIIIDLEPVAVSQNAPEPSATMASGAASAPQSAAVPVAEPQPEPLEAPPPEPAKDAPAPDPEPPPPPPPDAAPPVAEPPPPEKPPQPPPPVPPPPAMPPIAPPVVEPPPVTLPKQDTKSDAVLAPPPPLKQSRPKPPVIPPEPDPRQIAREAAARQALAERREQVRAQRAEARARRRAEEAATPREAGGASNQQQSASSATSGQSVSSWRGEVMARLNAVKPSSPDGSTGTTRVAFSVDRSGRVTSASVAESSGDGALDGAAVAMVRRASPLPPPPPDLGGRVSLSVPVRFR